MPLTDDQVKVAKLRGSLATAPRPKPDPDAAWMVQYMDWFFQSRIEALNTTESK